MLPPQLLERASRAYSSSIGRSVELREVKEFRAGRVARCRAAAPGTALGSVIVKVADQSDDTRRGLAALRNEHAALTFLRDRGSTSVARLLAADVDAGVIVIEDLGDQPTLAHLLLYAQRSTAERAAVGAATWLGRLHAETVGRSQEYQALQEQLPPLGRNSDADRFTLRGRDIRISLNRLPELLAAHDLPGLNAPGDLTTVIAELAEPGDLLAFSTGDPCPGNDAVIDNEVRGFDLEAAAFRHALIDAAHYVVPFPNCWCWRQLPDDLSAQMLDAHRQQLARSSTQAADATRYFEALTRTTSAWVIWTLDQRLRGAGQSPQAVTRIVVALENFVRLAREGDQLVELAEGCEILLGAIQARWQPPVATTYPAFGGPMWITS